MRRVDLRTAAPVSEVPLTAFDLTNRRIGKRHIQWLLAYQRTCCKGSHQSAHRCTHRDRLRIRGRSTRSCNRQRHCIRPYRLVGVRRTDFRTAAPITKIPRPSRNLTTRRIRKRHRQRRSPTRRTGCEICMLRLGGIHGNFERRRHRSPSSIICRNCNSRFSWTHRGDCERAAGYACRGNRLI